MNEEPEEMFIEFRIIIDAIKSLTIEIGHIKEDVAKIKEKLT